MGTKEGVVVVQSIKRSVAEDGRNTLPVATRALLWKPNGMNRNSDLGRSSKN